MCSSCWSAGRSKLEGKQNRLHEKNNCPWVIIDLHTQINRAHHVLGKGRWRRTHMFTSGHNVMKETGFPFPHPKSRETISQHSAVVRQERNKASSVTVHSYLRPRVFEYLTKTHPSLSSPLHSLLPSLPSPLIPVPFSFYIYSNSFI